MLYFYWGRELNETFIKMFQNSHFQKFICPFFQNQLILSFYSNV